MIELFDANLLVKMVDEFLEPFELDSDMDLDFCYDSEEDRVYFTVIVSERADRLFKEYVWKAFHFKAPSIFMLSLLHEVGHAYTLDDFTEKQLRESDKNKDILEAELDKNNSDEIYSLYFDLPIERAATEWAIDYYKENKQRCDDFYERFLTVLATEYTKMGVTE